MRFEDEAQGPEALTTTPPPPLAGKHLYRCRQAPLADAAAVYGQHACPPVTHSLQSCLFPSRFSSSSSAVLISSFAVESEMDIERNGLEINRLSHQIFPLTRGKKKNKKKSSWNASLCKRPRLHFNEARRSSAPPPPFPRPSLLSSAPP